MALPSLQQFLSLLGSVTTVVERLFPTVNTKAPYVAKMSARGGIPPQHFIRIAWRKKYAGVIYLGSAIQIGQIKDLYLEYGLNWQNDPLFRKPL
jgi:hypothetical protein